MNRPRTPCIARAAASSATQTHPDMRDALAVVRRLCHRVDVSQFGMAGAWTGLIAAPWVKGLHP